MNACLHASALGDINNLSVGAETRCRMSRRGAGTADDEKEKGGEEEEDEAARREDAMVCES